MLDLFSGAGGAAMGIHQALPDAEIVGVDVRPMPRYPFEFHQADALDFPTDGFDFIWASPPCQAFTPLRNRWPDRRYPNLIGRTRERLMHSDAAWVIENVPGSPLEYLITLCGAMFALRVYRHRLFEPSFPLLAPMHPRHERWGAGRHRGRISSLDGDRYMTVAGHDFNVADGRIAMGIDWMTGKELSQAIPPAYSRYILAAWAAQQGIEVAA